MIRVFKRIGKSFFSWLFKIQNGYSDWALRRFWKKDIRRRITDESAFPPEQIKHAKAYWSRWLKLDCVSHAFYTEKTGVFSEKYVPDYVFYNDIDPFYNDWNRAAIDNKTYYPIMFADIVQPKMICFRRGGMWSCGRDEVMHLIKGEGVAVVKEAEGSCGGHGVLFYDAEKDGEDLFWTFCNKTKHDLVVQEVVRQSSVLARLNQSSVNTIRVLSHLRYDGSVKIYSSILRMGIKGARVDNASSGGITCGICPDGRLKNVAYSANGDKYFEHPDSHVKFDSIVVPRFQEILAIVERYQMTMGHFRLVSWDFAVNEQQEPLLIEVNLFGGELDFHQLNNGPVFGDDLSMILDEVFAKGL